MNPEFPGAREEMESRITALLLGELSPEEADAVRAAMAKDADLARLHEKLRQTVDLVKAASEKALEPAGTSAKEPLRLSEEKREKLLAQFKTVKPAEFESARPRQPSWFVPVAAAALLMVFGGLAVMLMIPTRLQSRLERPVAFGSLSSSEVSEKLALSLYAQDDSKVADGADHSRHYFAINGSLQDLQDRSEPEREELARRQIRNGQELFENSAAGRKSGETMRAQIPEARSKIEQGAKPVVPPPMEVEKVPEFAQEVPALDFTPAPASAEPAMRQNERGFQAGAFIAGRGGASEATPQTEEKYRLGYNEDSRSIRISSESLKKLEDLRNEGRSVPGQSGFGGGGGFGAVSVPSQPVQTTNFYSYGLANTDADNSWELKDESGRILERWDTGGGSRGEVSPSVAPDRLSVLGDAPVVGKLFRSQEAEKKVAPVSGIVLPNVSTEDRVVADTTLTPSVAQNVHSANVIGYIDINADPSSAPASPIQMDGMAQAGQLELKDAATTEGSTLGYADAPEKTKIAENLDLFAKNSEAGPFSRRYGLERSDSSLVATEEPRAAVAEGGTKAVPQSPAPKPKIALKIKPSASASSRRPSGTPAPAKALQDVPALRPATPPPVPQPEVLAAENPFSTFSLNVADVSFKLAAASLEQGRMPDPGTIRSEEFINAFDYHDPEAAPNVPFAFAWERARYPFAHNRDLLRFSLKTAAQGRAANTPLNLVLLLDNSGSMERADRVSIRLEAIRVLAAKLTPQDKLSLITFARNAQLRIDGAAGAQAGMAAQEVANLTPEGGTNLEEAMRLGYETAFRHYVPGGVNRLILLTDGAANLGSTDAETLKPMVEDARRQGVAFDCFGIGWEGYNDELLEVLSRHGDGRYGFVNTPDEASSEFAAKLAGALQVAASDVKVQVEFNPARVSAYRQVGYAKHQLTKEQFRDNTVDAAEIAAAESGNALYLAEILPQGTGPLATVRVRYRNPATGEYSESQWTVPYTGTAPPLEQAGPALRLAAVAAAFSEWLAGNPYAAEVNPNHLLALMTGVKESYGIDPRPARLEMMIRQAKSISGR